MNDKQINGTNKPAVPEIQPILWICYILAVGIGMLFNYKKYSEFGINIFSYADVFDFLLAPFSDLTIILFTLISLILSYIFFKLDGLLKKNYPRLYSIMNFRADRKKWFNIYRYMGFGLLTCFYLYTAANIYGNLTYKKIRKQTPIEVRFADNETKKGIMIGKTKDIIFLLCADRVRAIPIAGLVREYEIPPVR